MGLLLVDDFGFVSFYKPQIKYESFISILKAIFVGAIALIETRAHRGLAHTQLLP